MSAAGEDGLGFRIVGGRFITTIDGQDMPPRYRITTDASTLGTIAERVYLSGAETAAKAALQAAPAIAEAITKARPPRAQITRILPQPGGGMLVVKEP